MSKFKNLLSAITLLTAGTVIVTALSMNTHAAVSEADLKTSIQQSFNGSIVENTEGGQLGIYISPDGLAFTTDYGVQGCDYNTEPIIIEANQGIVTIEDQLKDMQGYHAYSYNMQIGDQLKVARWVPIYQYRCIKPEIRSGAWDTSDKYHEITWGIVDEDCKETIYQGYFPVCATCGKSIDFYVYSSMETISKIEYLIVGTSYYYLCPNNDHLVRDGIVQHTCEAISANRHKVIYNSNSDTATGYMPTSIHYYKNATEYEGNEVVPSKTFTKNEYNNTGYLFLGWSTSPTGQGTLYTDEDMIPATGDAAWGIVQDGEITLYAQWVPSSSILDIDTNGGQFREDASHTFQSGHVQVTRGYGEQYELLESNLRPPVGYTVNFSISGSTVSPITANKRFGYWEKLTIPHPLYGRLAGNTYYYENSTTDTTATSKIDYIRATWETDSIILPDVATIENKEFSGWYEDNKFEIPAGQPGDEYTPTKSKTLYGSWIDMSVKSQIATSTSATIDLVDSATKSHSTTLSSYNRLVAENLQQGATYLHLESPISSLGKTFKFYQSVIENNLTEIPDTIVSQNISWTTLYNNIKDTDVNVETFTTVSNSYQYYTIQESGIYELELNGASGADYGINKGGEGSKVIVRLYLKQGDQIQYKLGASGNSTATGVNKGGIGYNGTSTNVGNGGGLSEVYIKSASTGLSTQLLIASGGGGASTNYEGGVGKGLGTELGNPSVATVNTSLGTGGGGGAGYAWGVAGHEHRYSGSLITATDGETKVSTTEGYCYQDDSQKQAFTCTHTIYLDTSKTGGTQAGFFQYGVDRFDSRPNESTLYGWAFGACHICSYSYTEDPSGYEERVKNGSLKDSFCIYLAAKHSSQDCPYYDQQDNFVGANNRCLNCGNWTMSWDTTNRQDFTVGVTDANRNILAPATASNFGSFKVLEEKTAYGLNCNTSEGQSQGGTSYVNSNISSTVTVISYTNAIAGGANKTVNNGNGYLIVTPIVIGFNDEGIIANKLSTDEGAPLAVDLSEDAIELIGIDDSHFSVEWQAPEDTGTLYYFTIKSFDITTNGISSETEAKQGNITKELIITGIQGYAYVIDTNQDTKIENILNTEVKVKDFTDNPANYSFKYLSGVNNTKLIITLTNQKQYLHIAAIDKSDNISATSTLELGSLTEPPIIQILYPVETEKLAISTGLDNVYQDGINYYVNGTPNTPFYIHYAAKINGVPSKDYIINHAIIELNELTNFNANVRTDAVQSTITRNSYFNESDYNTSKNMQIQLNKDDLSFRNINAISYLSTKEILNQHDYIKWIRNVGAKRIEVDAAFYFNDENTTIWDGKKIVLTPIAGIDYFDADEDTTLIKYSDYDLDKNNSITIYVDSSAPVLMYRSVITNKETGSKSYSAWTNASETGKIDIWHNNTVTDTKGIIHNVLHLYTGDYWLNQGEAQSNLQVEMQFKADDGFGSGVSDFQVIINNKDSNITKIFTPTITDIDGTPLINIDISDENNSYTRGRFELIAKATDNVGNESEARGEVIEIDVVASIGTIRSSEDSRFRGGETARIRLKVLGYPTSVDLTFDDNLRELAKKQYDREINKSWDLVWDTYSIWRDNYEFIIPLQTEFLKDIEVKTKAYYTLRDIDEYGNMEEKVIEIINAYYLNIFQVGSVNGDDVIGGTPGVEVPDIVTNDIQTKLQ